MINAKEVNEALLDCFYPEPKIAGGIGEVPAEAVKVEGILNTFLFDPKRVEAHREEINDWLDDLADEFHHDRGGGMSFLQACVDRHGNHWGEHINMDQLFVLGQAIGRVKYLLPRNMWSALPGSMPYLVIGKRDVKN